MALSFNERVYILTEAIPPGKVLNYGAVAELIGKPRAARAVGYALNGLPYGSEVPWHRVVGKEGIYGKISIRAYAYSSEEQYARLVDEGILFDENRRFRLIEYLWQPEMDEVAKILSPENSNE